MTDYNINIQGRRRVDMRSHGETKVSWRDYVRGLRSFPERGVEITDKSGLTYAEKVAWREQLQGTRTRTFCPSCGQELKG